MPTISPLAIPDSGTLSSRAFPQPPHPYRSPFARDAARILHARSFRRLAGKTQVFARQELGSLSDHFRSRLTHTLEVAQISRTAARALGLNAELAEALALAHDIGHPPFGHAGERALDEVLQSYNLGFDHNLHALRIVTFFEEYSPAWRGLNLTLATREGILKHSRDYAINSHPELADYFLGSFPPVEAQLIDLTDEIAYLAADLDDGLSSGILTLDELRLALPHFRQLDEETRRAYPDSPAKLRAIESCRKLVDRWVTGLIDETARRIATLAINSLYELRKAPSRVAALAPEHELERAATKSFLYNRLYTTPPLEESHQHAHRVIAELFALIRNTPHLLPPDHYSLAESQGLERTIADYIAGMTDSYSEQLWRRHCQHE